MVEDRTQPSPPARPTLASRDPKSRSWLSLSLAAFAGLVCYVALFVVLLQFGGPLAIVAALIMAVGGLIAGLHYLVWGWWLSKTIHEEVAAEQRAEQARRDERE